MEPTITSSLRPALAILMTESLFIADCANANAANAITTKENFERTMPPDFSVYPRLTEVYRVGNSGARPGRCPGTSAAVAFAMSPQTDSLTVAARKRHTASFRAATTGSGMRAHRKFHGPRRSERPLDHGPHSEPETNPAQIGRASCRERVDISVVAV